MSCLICILALGQFVQMINRYVLEIPIMGLEESLLYQTLWLYMQGAVNTSRAATGFRATSLINMAADEADVATLKAREARMQTAGLTHERIISRDELRERLRHVQPPCVGGGDLGSWRVGDPVQGHECLPTGRRTP